MRVPVRSSLAALAAAVTAAGIGVAALPATAAPSAAPVAAPTVVGLLTGDTVRLRPVSSGHTAVEVVTAAKSGLGAQWSRFTANDRVYVLPTIAKPYLGRVLDPELFDVTGGATPAARTNVDVSFPAGHPAAVPGLTVTSHTSTAAHGYLDAAGARRFGAALLTQFRHDAGARTTPTSLFGASRIARTGATPPVTPDFPQVTLNVQTLQADGSVGGFGTVGLINTDDSRRYVGFVFPTNGKAKVSVPLGHYAAVADISTFDIATLTGTESYVSVPDFTVTGSGQTVSLDVRTATATPSITTPRSAGLVELDAEYDRLVGANGFLGLGTAIGPGSHVKVAPSPAPKRGQVEFLTHWTLGATPQSGLPYRYDASFDDEGAIPADQHRVVAASQYATLTARYGTPGYPNPGDFGRAPVYPFQFFIGFSLPPQPGPLVRTEYLYAAPSATWLDSFIGAATDFNPFNGIVDDGFRVHPAGSQATVDWMRGPLAPGVIEPTDGDAFFGSNSCRTSDRMTIALASFTDTTPGHIGSIVPADTSRVASFSLTADGTTIARRPNATGGIFPVSPDAATYQATVTTDAGATGFAISTHAVTTLTFPSAGTGGATLPEGWACPSGDGATVLPLLTATVPLPTDLLGVMPIGANAFTFRIAPAAGAPAADVHGVTMGVSTDGGDTFASVPVSALGDNRFRASITNPASAAGLPVTLRLAGRTAAGSAITQTVTNAYTVAGS